MALTRICAHIGPWRPDEPHVRPLRLFLVIYLDGVWDSGSRRLPVTAECSLRDSDCAAFHWRQPYKVSIVTDQGVRVQVPNRCAQSRRSAGGVQAPVGVREHSENHRTVRASALPLRPHRTSTVASQSPGQSPAVAPSPAHQDWPLPVASQSRFVQTPWHQPEGSPEAQSSPSPCDRGPTDLHRGLFRNQSRDWARNQRIPERQTLTCGPSDSRDSNL